MDEASAVLLDAATLVLRADNATSSTTSSPTASSTSSASSGGRPPIYKTVGIILAISSGLFIGVSFVIKKIGLLKANKKYNEEAGEGYGYLKNAWWWLGMTLMIIGEICNFAAYMFVDAIIVTPMGALSVVITAILSAIFLKERLSFVGKIGCFQCILGSVIIVVSAPEQSAVADIQEMQHYVIAPGFLTYAGVIIVGCIVVVFWAGPKYGKKSMLVYLTVCSLIGGLSVVATQGLGSAIIAQINGESEYKHWFLYVLFFFVIATLLTEIVYLNKALNLFNAALVTPTYYVYFTSSTIVASAILFRGFHGTPTAIANVILGFFVICSGVVLLQLAKSSKDVPDTAVFQGDLDQVRTVAEQEEPQYEPHADAIRGGGSIVRAMSKARFAKEVEEAHKLRAEMMSPIGEDEAVEWDGLRRRKTVSTIATGSVRRRKTIHPPLGISARQYSEASDEISEPDSELHPGFFGRIGRSRRTSRAVSASQPRVRTGVSPVHMSVVSPNKTDSVGGPTEHVYGLPPGLRGNDIAAADGVDTSYKSTTTGVEGPHIHWVSPNFAAEDHEDRAPSRDSLAPPKPPPHRQRRQFSFQNILRPGRKRDDSDPDRPVSRGALSFGSRHSDTPAHETEEERLGLVHGDSPHTLPRYDTLPVYEEEDEARSSSRGGGGRRTSPSDDGSWQMASAHASAAGSSPEVLGGDLGELGKSRSRDPYDDDDDELYDAPLRSPKEDEGPSGSRDGGNAFV